MKGNPPAAKTCHRCGYDLSGLPEDYRCPECGLRYDADTRSWRPSEPWIASVVMMGVAGYLGLHVLALRGGLVFLVSRAVIIVMLLVLAAISWRRHRKGILVAVHPEGVFVRDHFCEEFLDWASIEDLNVDIGAGPFFPRHRLHLRLTSGRRIPLTTFFLWSADKKAFASVFGLARQRHAAASGDAPR
ncbi:MAG: hypothetical protein FLDDKLPJ_00423 [Phycisphaerae bacterium]|nr:hypothetical protein [Phycisphaerae bacterium]